MPTASAKKLLADLQKTFGEGKVMFASDIPVGPPISTGSLALDYATGYGGFPANRVVEICGKEATLRFDGIAHDVNSFTIRPEGYNQRKDIPSEYERGKTPGQPNHMVDFFNCVRSRGTPKCPVDEAFVETATYLMSVESYKQKRRVRWDAVKEEIV